MYVVFLGVAQFRSFIGKSKKSESNKRDEKNMALKL